MMATDREAALERVRKLLRMTRANGCTEAEAMAAAEKAARLMAELGVDAGDVEFAAARAKMRSAYNSPRSPLWSVIAECTSTAMILDNGDVEYIGADPWPEVARYLHQVTDRAIDGALREFHAGKWYRRRSSVRAKRAATFDFTQAMVYRLSVNLEGLFAGSKDDAREEAAKAELVRRYPAMETVKRRLARPKLGYYDQAGTEGMAAGNGVALSHGVGAAGGPMLIGGGG